MEDLAGRNLEENSTFAGWYKIKWCRNDIMMVLTQPFCLRYYLISPHLTFGSHPKFSEEIPGSPKNINSRNPKMIDSDTRKRLGCSRRAPFPMVLRETNNQKHPCLFKHLSHPDTANKGTIGSSLSKRNKIIMNYALIWRVKRILDLSVIAEMWGFYQTKGKVLKGRLYNSLMTIINV